MNPSPARQCGDSAGRTPQLLPQPPALACENRTHPKAHILCDLLADFQLLRHTPAWIRRRLLRPPSWPAPWRSAAGECSIGGPRAKPNARGTCDPLAKRCAHHLGHDWRGLPSQELAAYSRPRSDVTRPCRCRGPRSAHSGDPRLQGLRKPTPSGQTATLGTRGKCTTPHRRPGSDDRASIRPSSSGNAYGCLRCRGVRERYPRTHVRGLSRRYEPLWMGRTDRHRRRQ